MRVVIDWDGRGVDCDSAVALVDGDVRGGLHVTLVSCFERDFFDACLIARYVGYGEEFIV